VAFTMFRSRRSVRFGNGTIGDLRLAVCLLLYGVYIQAQHAAPSFGLTFIMLYTLIF